MTNAFPIAAPNSPAKTSNTIDWLATAWCRLMHGSVMWPVRGHYACRDCGRRYSVPW